MTYNNNYYVTILEKRCLKKLLSSATKLRDLEF